VKFINEKRNRSFKTILKFFEDSDFRYQAKKSHRTRYRDYFEKFYLNYCYFRDHDFIDSKIGEGVDKVVFTFSKSHHKVIKLYKDLDGFEKEKQNYETLLDIRLDNLVPQMAFYSQYSIIERAAPVRLNRVPRILFKIVLEQLDFGIIDDRILMLDLGEIYQDVIRQNLGELRLINRS
jgi:signal peptidase I